MYAAIRTGWACFLVACSTASAAPDAGRVALPSDRVARRWADVSLDGIYLGTQQLRETRAGNELCVTPTRTASGPARTAAICTRIADLQGPLAAWDPLPLPGNGQPLWIAVRRDRILTVALDSCGTARCTAPPTEDMFKHLVCHQLGQLWAAMPPDDTHCDRDADCTVLADNCLDVGVRGDRAALYNELAARNGGCRNPAAGACSPPRGARCRAHVCQAFR